MFFEDALTVFIRSGAPWGKTPLQTGFFPLIFLLATEILTNSRVCATISVMKYVLVLGDGMADYPVPELNGKTPLSVANKPYMDFFAQNGRVGLVKTIPDGFKPGSDTANISVLGYSPKKYYTGRSPLEAVSLGVKMEDDDIAVRMNTVTLSLDEPFEKKTMVDYSAGEITSAESRRLVAAVADALGDEIFNFYPGVSYRHCLIVKHGKIGTDLTPPHDISGRCIADYLPKGIYGEKYLEFYKKAYEVLKNHPVNLDRVRRGLNPANCIWFWGEGTKPMLSDFQQKYGKSGIVVSAVDLLKGIAISANMAVAEVDGATGTVSTNYEGKTQAAIAALDNGTDFAYLHLEATDESGHHGNVQEKITGIEYLDSRIIAPIYKHFAAKHEDVAFLVLPDHPTPIVTMTHASDPVPFVMWNSKTHLSPSAPSYDEITAKNSGLFLENSEDLLPLFFAD